MKSSKINKYLVIGLIGNAIEWYDYAIFNSFALVLSKNFFSPNGTSNPLIFTFVIFSLGFLARPFGGLLFGYVGDIVSRKTSLIYSFLLMAIPTMLIGIMPTYSQIGILSPFLLAIIRIMQGLSVGGTLPGSILLLDEEKCGKASFLTSLPIAGSFLGFALGAITSFSLSLLFSEQEIDNYAWRIPFLLSFFLAYIAYYIKRNLTDVNNPLTAQITYTHLWTDMRKLALSIGVLSTPAAFFYTAIAFLTTLLNHSVGLSKSVSSLLHISAMLIMFVSAILGGKVSELVDVKKILPLLSGLLLIATIPVLFFLEQQNWLITYWLFCPLCVLLGLYFGLVPSFLLTTFHKQNRYTYIALTYGISFAIFGGTSPAIITFILEKLHNLNVISLYLIIFSIVSLFSLKQLSWAIYEPQRH